MKAWKEGRKEGRNKGNRHDWMDGSVTTETNQTQLFVKFNK